MRTAMALTAGALLILTFTAASPSRAEIMYPWCVQYGGGRNGIGATSCGFDSYAQCMMTASGTNASCVENPGYPPARNPATRHRRRHHVPE